MQQYNCLRTADVYYTEKKIQENKTLKVSVKNWLKSKEDMDQKLQFLKFICIKLTFDE